MSSNRDLPSADTAEFPVLPIQGPESTIRIPDTEERKSVQSLPNEAIIQIYGRSGPMAKK
jgi:hypothetical protein